MPGALDGIVVADFSRVLAGPYATMLLADLGATVIKVERPGTGDDTRLWGPPWSHGVSTYFQAVNRGKTCLVLDLADPDDLDAALDLCGRADVVIENFRPGTMERLGLGYAALDQLNPRLVYCSITGFGTAGGVDLPGYDLLVQAVGGLMSISGPDSAHPTKTGVALVDVITGLHALVGLLAALRHRETSGHGQLVEVNLLTSLLSAMVNQSSAYLNTGMVPVALGNAHPSIAPYQLLQAADRPLAVAVGNDRQFAAMCDELGVAHLATDVRFAHNAARVGYRDTLADLLEAALAGHTADEWTKRLSDRGVPCGPINRVDEAIAYAEGLGLAPVVDLVGTDTTVATRQIRCPIDLSASPASYPAGPPLLPTETR